MSKLQLKKELAALDRDQLIKVILTAYSSSKAVKNYFDFFADPDIDRLTEKHIKELTKEIERGKWHKSTARISRIRKSLKEFESLNPGVEHIRNLRLKAIELLINQSAVKQYSDTLINGTLKLIDETIVFADNNLIFDSTINYIRQLLADTDDPTRHFRRYLRKIISYERT